MRRYQRIDDQLVDVETTEVLAYPGKLHDEVIEDILNHIDKYYVKKQVVKDD